MTERGTARHRAPSRATTPLTTISTGITQVVGEGVGALGRNGAVMAVSTGLVASMALPAAPSSPSTPQESAKAEPQTAPLALDRTAMQLAGSPLLTVSRAGGSVSRGGPLSAPASASLAFDNGSLSRVSAQDEQRASRSAARRAAMARARTAEAERPSRAAEKAATATRRAAGTTSTTKTVTRKAAKKTTKPKTTKPKTTKPKTTTVAPSARGSTILAIAARYVGIPYRYGGTTPAGFDCSGFTQYVYRQVGISLPRTAAAQMAATTRISRSQARPGDLVFVVGGGTTGHVGIYAGGNMMYDSPRTGKSLSKRAIWTSSVVFGRV